MKKDIKEKLFSTTRIIKQNQDIYSQDCKAAIPTLTSLSIFHIYRKTNLDRLESNLLIINTHSRLFLCDIPRANVYNQAE